MSWLNPLGNSSSSVGSNPGSRRNSDYEVSNSAGNVDRICQEYLPEIEANLQKEQEQAKSSWFSWGPRFWPFSSTNPESKPIVPEHQKLPVETENDDASVASSDDGDQEFFDCEEAPPEVKQARAPDTANFVKLNRKRAEHLDPMLQMKEVLVPLIQEKEAESEGYDSGSSEDVGNVESDNESEITLNLNKPSPSDIDAPPRTKLLPLNPSDTLAKIKPPVQEDDTASVDSDDGEEFEFFDALEPTSNTLEPKSLVEPEPVQASSPVAQIQKTDQAGRGFFGGLLDAAKWTTQQAAGAAFWAAGKAKEGAVWAGHKGVEIAPSVPGYVQPIVDWGHKNYPAQTETLVNAAKTGAKAAAWVGIKAAENIAFWSFNPAEIQSQNKATLKQLTGNDNLHNALTSLAPFIANLIQKEAIESKLGQGMLSELARGEKPFIMQLLQTLLPKTIINVHAHMKANSPEGPANENYDPTLDILTHLFSVINTNFEKIHPLIQEAEAQGKSKEEIRKIFAGLVQELLAMAMPHGKEDLPVISKLQGYLWDFIQDSFLPDQLYDLYHQFMDPQLQSKKAKLAAHNGSGNLVKLADMASEMAVGSLPKAIAKQNETIASIAIKEVFIGQEAQGPEVKAWLGNLIKELGKSKNPELQKVWKFVGNSIEPIVAHVFLNLVEEAKKKAGKGKEPKDIAFDITNQMLTLFTEFVDANKSKLDARLGEIEQFIGVEPDEDPEFVAMFKPLSDKMLAMAGLDKPENFPAAGMVRAVALPAIADGIPKLLAKGYRDMANAPKDRVQYQARLRQVLNPNESQEGVLAQKSETVAQHLEKLCGFMAGSITKVVTKYLNGNTPLKMEKDSQAQAVWGDFVKKNLETLLLKVMVNYAERTPEVIRAPEGGHPKALLPANMVVRLADVMGKKLKEAKPRMDNAEKIVDPKLRNKAMRKAMRPLANELLSMFGPKEKESLLKDLPLPMAAGEQVLTALEKQLLPDLLVEMYQDTTAWEREVGACREQLFAYYKTTHVQEACHVIAQYVADFVPHLLSTSHEDLAATIFKVLEKQLAESGITEANELTAYLKSHPEEVMALLAENMKALGESQDPAIKALNPVIHDQMEAVLLKVFANLSKKIYDKENPAGAHYQQEFLSNAAISLMKVMSDHLRKVNSVQRRNGVNHAHELSQEQLLKAFGSALHGGVPNSPEALQAQKKIAEAKQIIRAELKVIQKGRPENLAEARRKIKAAKAVIKKEQEIVNESRKKNFFIPFTNELMKLLEIDDPNNLPFPAPIREEILELVKNNLLPEVLMKLYELILDPNTLNKIVLNTLDTFNETMEQIAREEKENPGRVSVQDPVPEDDLQKKMNLACGQLVLEMVEMMPNSLTNKFFKSEGIRKMAAEKVGEAVRRQLSQNWTMMKIIDKGIVSGLPNFRDGEWEGKAGQEVFTAKKFSVETGEKQAVTEALKFSFPKTEAEIEADDIKKMLDEEVTARKVKRTMVKTVTKQAKTHMKAAFVDKWRTFQSFVDTKIEKLFGSKGKAVKDFCDKICSAVVFTGLGTVLKIIGWPIYKATWFLIELYIGHRAKHILKNMHMSIHENMLYKASETILDALQTKDSGNSTNLVDQIILNTERRKARNQIAELRRQREDSSSDLEDLLIKDMKFEDVQRSLMGSAVTPKVLAADHERKFMKLGLEAIEGQFKIYPIKGDGHCLFRSIAAGILLQFKQNGPGASEELFENIRKALSANQRLDMAADIAKMKSIVQNLYSEEAPASVEMIMQDKDFSNEMVRILRRLACVYNRENMTDTLLAEIEASGLTAGQYFKAMEDMDSKSMGGEPEIVALSQCFKKDIKSIDVEAIGRGDLSPDEFEGQNASDLFVLFRGEHFDLAVKT